MSVTPSFPDVAVPNVAVPNVAVPNVAVPNVAVPNVAVPNVAVPSVAARRTTFSGRASQRVAALLGTLIAAVVVLLGGASPAWAGDSPDSLSIAGTGLRSPITIRDAQQPELFALLLDQVSWMAGRTGDPMKVDKETLGPKYTVTVLAKGTPVQAYDLYPQATGGPRAYRPAAQPTGKTSEAWFYAPVSLPNLLHAAGVPLTDPNASGQAGGLSFSDPIGYVPQPQGTASPDFSLSDAWRQERRALLASAGAALFVLLLVFAAARFSLGYEQRVALRRSKPSRSMAFRLRLFRNRLIRSRPIRYGR